MQNWNPIFWSPFAVNVLDAGSFNLTTKDGQAVTVAQNMNGEFMLTIGNEAVLTTRDNLRMSYCLNILEIGGTRKQ